MRSNRHDTNTHAFNETYVPKGARGVARVVEAVRCSSADEAEHAAHSRRWPHYSRADIRQTPDGWCFVDTAPRGEGCDDPLHHQTSARLRREKNARIDAAVEDMLRQYERNAAHARRRVLSDILTGMGWAAVLAAAGMVMVMHGDTVAAWLAAASAWVSG